MLSLSQAPHRLHRSNVSYTPTQLLEALFNERLRARYHVATNLQPEEDGAIRWLCKKVERRHDDTVSLLPFTRIVREVLSLSEAELPQRQLLSLWLSGLKPIPIPDARRALGTTTAPPVKPPATVTLRDIQQFFRRGGIGESRVGEAEQATVRRERLATGESPIEVAEQALKRFAAPVYCRPGFACVYATLRSPSAVCSMLPVCLCADNQAIAASVRAELTERIRAPPEAMFGGATAASRADVRALAELMNEQMVGLFAPNERSFYHLFKFMDTDGSEVIEFDEFESMVRKQLRLGPQEVPFDRLLGLWRAIDADGSGRVCAGEFGRFMRFGCADSLSEPKGAVTPRRTRISQGGNPMADAQARLRAHRARQRDKETDDSQGEAARRVKQSARGLDMEAQRLAAQIAEKERSARGRH